MNVLELSLDQGESGVLSIPTDEDTTGAYISWSVWLRPGKDVIFKDNGTVGGVTVIPACDESDPPTPQTIDISITSAESSLLDPIRYNHELCFTKDSDRYFVTTGTLVVTRRNVVDSVNVFTSAADIQGLLRVSEEIPTVILLQSDVWVRAKMKSMGVTPPTPPKATEDMRLAGAMIGCCFVIRSHESDKSWWQSINIAGASVSQSDAAAKWETYATELITAMSNYVQPLFSTQVYEDQNYEYS